MAFSVPGLYGDSIDLDVTVVANEVLESSMNHSIHKRLCRNIPFAGAGMVMDLGAIDALSFSSHTEGDEITSETPDINVDQVTIVEYTCDVNYSTIAKNYSGANAVQALVDEMGTAYAKNIDAQIGAVIEAATGNDVDHNGAMTIDHAAEAYANLLADGAPAPYYLVLTGADWSSMYSTNGNLVTAGNQSSFMAGPNGEYYVGNVAGFQTYVAPFETRTRFYSPRGVVWAQKPVIHPGGNNAGSELNIGFEWVPAYRAEMCYATFLGDAIVRTVNGTAGGWVGNIYNAA